MIRKLFYLASIGASIFLLFVVVTFSWLRFEVKGDCQRATRKYGVDCVPALSKTLEDATNDARTRNSAIWTLGQLADKRALPVLKKYYTGRIPPREPLDKTISQYELRKAIRWCTEGNITSWMYQDEK